MSFASVTLNGTNFTNFKGASSFQLTVFCDLTSVGIVQVADGKARKN